MSSLIEQENKVININLKEGKNLKFSLNIVSDKPVSSKPLIRLVLTVSDKLSVILSDGKLYKSGEIEFNVPPMYKILFPRKYNCDLEMVIDGQFFLPFSFQINFI